MPEIKIEKTTEEKPKELETDKWNPWECEPSTFDWSYEFNEDCYVLGGRVKVKKLNSVKAI